MAASIRKTTLTNAKKRTSTEKKGKTPNKGQEKRCVDNFRDLGLSEVVTPLGYIDLLTPKYIVEFKIYTRSKDALGQILCYSNFVSPKRQMLIVLFGKGLSTWKGYAAFEKICAMHNVAVYKLSHTSKYAALRLLLT